MLSEEYSDDLCELSFPYITKPVEQSSMSFGSKNRELKQQRRQRQMSLESKICLGNGDYFVIYASSSYPIVDRARCKWTGRSLSAIEANIENERFTVVCSRCR